MTTPDFLTHLAALAEKATPGPWVLTPVRNPEGNTLYLVHAFIETSCDPTIAGFWDKNGPNAAFISACTPEVVAALVVVAQAARDTYDGLPHAGLADALARLDACAASGKEPA